MCVLVDRCVKVKWMNQKIFDVFYYINGKAPILDLLGMKSASLLAILPGPHLSGVILLVSVLSMDHIEVVFLFDTKL